MIISTAYAEAKRVADALLSAFTIFKTKVHLQYLQQKNGIKVGWGDREPRPIPVFQILPGDSFFLPGDSL